MGQEQSAPTPRRALNRLSKPRTNNSTANLLAFKSALQLNRRDSQNNNAVPANNRYSVVPVDAVLGERDEELKEEKQKKRRSIFRIKGSQEKEHSFLNAVKGREFVQPVPVEKPVHRWLRHSRSRTNSITYESPIDPSYAAAKSSRPLNRTRMSLQHVPYAQQLSRLSFVSEAPLLQPKAVGGSKRLSSCGEEMSPQLSDPLNNRTNSDTELYVPMRRRSFLQHGVATRTSWIDNQYQQSAPMQIHQPEELQSYYYNPSKPASSPLDHLAALRYAEEPGTRVETPDELDYGHIGAFKLGSLRIMNGAASPSPSIERAATMGNEEDYIAAGHRRHGFNNRSHTFSVPPEAQKAPWVVRSESPLRQSHESDHLTINTHIPVPDPSLAAFDFQNSQELFKRMDSPTKSQELANEYIQDIALSPFSFGPSRSTSPNPGLQATSKHTVTENELFEAEPSTPSLSHTPCSFDSGYGGSNGASFRTVKAPRELGPQPLTKADSGYSSNMSLRSFRISASRNGRDAPALPRNQGPPTPPKEAVSRVPSSTYSFTSSIATESIVYNRTLPALQADEPPIPIPVQPFRNSPHVLLKHSNVYGAGRDMLAPELPGKTLEQSYSVAQNQPHAILYPQHGSQKSIPAPIPQAMRKNYNFGHNRSGSDSNLSNEKLSWGSSKKEKQRSHSIQPQRRVSGPVFTVQALHSPAHHITIPPVSAAASRSLEERVDLFPLNSFPNTFQGVNEMIGLRKSSSKETLGTIFSAGSGYTDLPLGREALTVGRLQSALPAPPASDRSTLKHTYQSPTSEQMQPNTLQKNPIQAMLRDRSLVDARTPSQESLQMQKRAKSMTSQLEVDAAAQFANVRDRNLSGDSWRSAVSSSTISSSINYTAASTYTSIVNGNPFASPQSRTTSSEYGLPSTYQTSSQALKQPVSVTQGQILVPTIAEEIEVEGKCLAWLASGRKERGPPPVSIHSQGKLAPTDYVAHSIVPPGRLTSMAPTPTGQLQQILDRGPPALASAPKQQLEQTLDYVSPLPLVHTSPLLGVSNSNGQDPLPNQQNLWAGQRQSAGGALQVKTRKSMDAVNARKGTDSIVRARKSMDAVNARKSTDNIVRTRKSMGAVNSGKSTEIRRCPSSYQNNDLRSRKSLDVVNARKLLDTPKRDVSPNLRTHWGFDSSQREKEQFSKWDPGFSHSYVAGRQEIAKQSMGEYDHTYGRIASPNKENRSPSPDKQYYDGPGHDFDYQNYQKSQDIGQNLHWSQNSTSDMMVLDQFTECQIMGMDQD